MGGLSSSTTYGNIYVQAITRTTSVKNVDVDYVRWLATVSR